MNEKIDFIQNQLIATKRRFFPVLSPEVDISGSLLFKPQDLGKRPMNGAWQKTKPSEVLETEKYRKSNIGIALDPTDFVVDIDWYKEVGKQSYQKLCEDFGMDIISQSKVVVRTGGGGLHVWFKKPANVDIVKKHPDYPGIEFLSHRSYVVAPYSLHTSGNRYEFDDPFMELSEAETAPINAAGVPLYDLVKRKSRMMTDPDHQSAVGLTDSQVNIDMATEYLIEYAEPAVEGTRNNTLYQIACKCFNLGVSAETAIALILEHYNPHCLPPMDEMEVETTVRNACNYMEEGKKGSESIEAVYAKVDDEDSKDLIVEPANPNEWKSFLKVNAKTGIPVSDNYYNALMTLTECPDFKNKIVFDDFEQEVKYVRPMPWKPKEKLPPEGKMFGEDELVRLRGYLNRHVGIDCSPAKTNDALREAALENASNPVKNYIETLQWDRTPRVDRWLWDICGVKPNEYTCAVARKLLAAMIQRVYNPGCKFDYIVILEGNQGARKSSLCEALGAPWTASSLIDPTKNDAYLKIRGKWVVEIPEFDKYSRIEAGHLKSFITDATDRYRDPYARRMRDVPRTSVFIATTNKNVYLHDNTGNRRYWPISCRKIEVEKFKDMRDQLIAEAFYKHCKKPEPLYLETEEMQSEARAAQYSREIGDSWEEVIAEWLESPAGDEPPICQASAVDIWSGAFLKAPSDLDKRNRNRISDVMRNLGWESKRVKSKNGVPVMRYVRPTAEDIVDGIDEDFLI